MTPSANLLNLIVSPIGLKCLKHRQSELQGVKPTAPVLTFDEVEQLKQLEFECVLSGQQLLKKMYKNFREDALAAQASRSFLTEGLDK